MTTSSDGLQAKLVSGFTPSIASFFPKVNSSGEVKGEPEPIREPEAYLYLQQVLCAGCCAVICCPSV